MFSLLVERITTSLVRSCVRVNLIKCDRNNVLCKSCLNEHVQGITITITNAITIASAITLLIDIIMNIIIMIIIILMTIIITTMIPKIGVAVVISPHA